MFGGRDVRPVEPHARAEDRPPHREDYPCWATNRAANLRAVKGSPPLTWRWTRHGVARPGDPTHWTVRDVGRAGSVWLDGCSAAAISVAGAIRGAYDDDLGVFALSTPRAVDHMTVPSGTSSLLLGRERDIAELDEALGLAAQGTPQIALVGGDAGIGKTTLVADNRTPGGRAWVHRGDGTLSRPRGGHVVRPGGRGGAVPPQPGSRTSGRGRRRVGCSPCWTRTHRVVGRRSMCWTTSPRSSSRQRPPARSCCCWRTCTGRTARPRTSRPRCLGPRVGVCCWC